MIRNIPEPALNIIFGIVMLVAGAGLLWLYWTRRRARLALLKDGIPATGIVTRVNVATSISGVNMYEVAYKYKARDSQGKVIEIQAPEAEMVDPLTLQAIQERGGELDVIYDAANPQHVIVVGRSRDGGIDKIIAAVCAGGWIIGLFLLVQGISQL